MSQLGKRFKPLPSGAFRALEETSSTIDHVRDREDPSRHVTQTIQNDSACCSKNAATNVLLAYNHTDVRLRCMTDEPTETTNIEDFMAVINTKETWSRERELFSAGLRQVGFNPIGNAVRAANGPVRDAEQAGHGLIPVLSMNSVKSKSSYLPNYQDQL